MDKFWMVLSDISSVTTYRHPTLTLAKTEATRLARGTPGVRFFVLGSEGFAVKRDVDWITPMHAVTDDEIPF